MKFTIELEAETITIEATGKLAEQITIQAIKTIGTLIESMWGVPDKKDGK